MREPITLCETCARATARDCAFMRERDPVLGLALVGVTDVDVETKTLKANYTPNGTYVVYKVRRCPRYRRGPVPPIAKGVAAAT